MVCGHGMRSWYEVMVPVIGWADFLLIRNFQKDFYFGLKRPEVNLLEVSVVKKS